MPSGNPTRYPVFHPIPDLTRFSFENHRVAGNPKYRVLPDISGKPEVSGITQYFGYCHTPISGATYISDVVFHWSNQRCYIHLWCCFFPAVLHTSLMSLFSAVLYTSLILFFIGPSLSPIEYIFPHSILHILYYQKCRYHHKNIHFSVFHGPKEFIVAFDYHL